MKRTLAFAAAACLLAGAAGAAGLPDGTKGTLDLKVAVQDELGVDTVSDVIELRNVKASELEPFIRARLSRWGAVQTNDALNMIVLTDKKEKLRDLGSLVRRMDDRKMADFIRLETASIPLKYTDPADLEAPVRAQLSPDGQLLVDRAHNALVVTDLASKVARARGLVAALDAFVPQAEVEVAVVTSSGDLLRNAGIDWSVLSNPRLGGTVEYTRADGSGPYYPYGEGSQTRLNFNGLPDLTGLLNIVSNSNKASLSLHATLSSANGRAAELGGGEQAPRNPVGGSTYYNNNTPQASGPGQQPETGRDDAFRLRMTPRIGADGVATLALDLSSNSFLGWRQDNTPIVDTRTLRTDAVLKDGQVLALGGLKKAVTVETDKGIPGLRAVLPFLFSRRSKSVQEEDVTVFLRLKLRLKPEDIATVPAMPEAGKP